MFRDFLFSVNATLPVFLVMVVGFVLSRRGFLTEGFRQTGNRLVFRLCLPAMLMGEMAGLGRSAFADGRFLAFAFVFTLVSVPLVWGLARLTLRDRGAVGAFAQGAFRGNTALLGTVLLQSICGSGAYGPLIILAAVPLYNILSVIILSLEQQEERPGAGQLTAAVGRVARNPILWGILLGLPFALGLPMPAMAGKCLSLLGQTASPLSLLVIGAGFCPEDAGKKLGPTLGAAGIKLAALPGAALALGAAAGFRGEALVALLVMTGTPAAVSSAIMAENMGGDRVLANGIVAVTTLLSAVTVTGWIFLLRTLQLI